MQPKLKPIDLAPAVAVALAAALALSGCASTRVQRLATAGAPAYELRGATLFALEQQAQALCPRGHEVVRQWEQHTVAGDEAAAWWVSARAVVNPRAADQAQMTVQCRA